MNDVSKLNWPQKIKQSEPWYKRLFKPYFLFDSCNEQIFHDIKYQLEQRSSHSLSEWDSYIAIKKNAAIRISEILKCRLEWPNTYFVPEDPAEIVFWDRYGDLDIVEAIMEIEKEFDINTNDEYWQSINNKFFGDVVKDIINKKI